MKLRRGRSAQRDGSMRWRRLTVVLIALPLVSAAADDRAVDPFVEKELVIVRSTRDFAEASRIAASAATALGLTLEMRGVAPDAETGLTFAQDTCRDNGLDHPCYVPRGRSDDGRYASVEWSNYYDGLAKGFYIVVVSTASPGSAETRRVLASAREQFPDAYAKPAKVYAGCMH